VAVISECLGSEHVYVQLAFRQFILISHNSNSTLRRPDDDRSDLIGASRDAGREEWGHRPIPYRVEVRFGSVAPLLVPMKLGKERSKPLRLLYLLASHP
jgi:hypothetical protein